MSAPSIPVGSGPVRNGTFLSFSISDKVSLRVNVGSGDALLTTTDITVPEIGSSLTLGVSYNSLLVGSGVATGSLGAYGWRQREGGDVQLYPASDGSVTYLGEDGTAGKFIPSGSGYTSPPQFHVTLAKSTGSTCGGTGYTMTWHATGEIMCFTTAGLLASQADRNGNSTAFLYSGGLETQVAYTPHGAPSPTQTVTVRDTGNFVTGLTQYGGAAGTKAVTYNVNVNQSTGNLDSLPQADDTKIRFDYDSSHNLTSVQNGAGNVTTLTYDSAHRVTSVTQPATGAGTATTRFAYVSPTETQVADPNTDQASPVSSVPNTTYAVAPATSLITKAVDQQGNTRSTGYTPFNDVAASTSGTGGKTTNIYGANSGESLTSSQSPTGGTSSLAYGNARTPANPTAAFQPSTSTDAQGNATAYTYDGPGNLQQSKNALAAVAKVSYNSDGTPASSTDPANGTNATTYGYTDGSHELNTITPPAGSSLKPETVTYDGFGRVSTVTDGNANTVTYTYDLADRVLQAAHTGGPGPVTVSYAYDGAGNTTTQTDPSGTITYGYDGRNLLSSRTADSGGGTLSYGYDLDANLTSVQDAGGTTSYAYGTRNLLTGMTDLAGHLWQFSYDAAGRRTATWFNTNTAESVWSAKMVTAYDQAGRISRLQTFVKSTSGNATADRSYCYSTFVAGRSCPSGSAPTDTAILKYATDNLTGKVSQYTYDKGNRLKSASNINGNSYAYTYDTDGNLTAGAPAGILSYNSGNQIITSGYGYDGAGNQATDHRNGALAYNDAGQMTTAATPANGPEHFSYAGDTQSQVLSDGTATAITYGLAGPGGQPWVQSYTPATAGSPPA